MRFFSLFILLLFFFNHPLLLQAESETSKGIHYEFNHADSCYSFLGRFDINTELDCLFDVLYNFNHLKNIIPNAKSITLVQQEKNWYDVEYTFSTLLLTNKSVYRKTLQSDQKKILFEMISFEQNTGLLPKMLSSSGYYSINGDSTGYTVEYFQECTLTSSILKNIYTNKAKKESIKFMQRLKEYLKKSCR